MAIVHLFSLLLTIVALMLLGADVVTTLELGGQFVTRSLDTVVALVAGSGPDAWIEATLPPSVAGPAARFFALPAWLPLGVVGVLLGLVSGPRRD